MGPQPHYLTASLLRDLRRIVPDGVCQDVDLAIWSRWRIGGPADCIVEPSSCDQLGEVVRLCRAQNIPYVILGETSNLLFADEGLRAVAIRVGKNISGVSRCGATFIVRAGTWVPAFARIIGAAGFSGVEHTIGIPGTVGGLVYMNGGSLRRSISECVVNVTYIDKAGAVLKIPKVACEFGYRKSRFQSEEVVISEIEFHFDSCRDRAMIRRDMLKILRDRRAKFPKKMPNCGSVFKADENLYREYGPPGLVLDQLGFKGRRLGGAQVSFEHANFINNIGGAKAADVRDLAKQMQMAVFDQTGYLIEPEALFVTSSGSMVPLI